MSERLLPRSEVERLVGLRRSAIYDRMAAGTFPAPVQEPGTRNVRWLASEVEAWIQAATRWPRAGGSRAGTETEQAKAA